jgi:hypothetical protein
MSSHGAPPLRSSLEAPASRVQQRRFGILCVLAYVALSWAVRFDLRRGEQIASLLYPLDTFSMYAGIPESEARHLLIRDPQGAVHHVTEFHSFACAEPISGSAARCSKEHGIQYHYEDLIDYIQSHTGPGESDAELIFRTWRVRPGAVPEFESDCVIAHCKVAR